MMAEVVVFTVVVVIVNWTDVEPPGTGTFAGTAAAALLLDRETMSPPAGATPVSVTVPVEDVPPLTDTGFMVTVLTTGALTVSTAVFVTPR